MFKKNCKTPLHDQHCGSVPNAALVPQTDIQPRYQQRRRRNSSSSSVGIRRPGGISTYPFLIKIISDLFQLYLVNQVIIFSHEKMNIHEVVIRLYQHQLRVNSR